MNVGHELGKKQNGVKRRNIKDRLILISNGKINKEDVKEKVKQHLWDKNRYIYTYEINADMKFVTRYSWNQKKILLAKKLSTRMKYVYRKWPHQGRSRYKKTNEGHSKRKQN